MVSDALRFLEVVERLANLVQARLKVVGARHGLKPVHVQILLFLATANRYSNTPQAVAEYFGLTKGTVSQSLILLETKGLLERAGDANDGRVVRLLLTPVAQAVAKESEQRGAIPFRGLDGARLDGLSGELTAVLRHVQVAEGRRSFGVCRSCRHHRAERRGRWRCGLTGEPLTSAEGERICREHEAAADA